MAWQERCDAHCWRLHAVQVKHLKTLGMDQVAAAIRTHGMGLADNAVNVTYQFLARKVNMLSEVSILTTFWYDVATEVMHSANLLRQQICL